MAHIYGVDIDPQAVETTKLSLLLKVLEGENAESIGANLRLFHERALPDLGDNIKCGNSLIGPDFYDGQQMLLLDENEQLRVNVFDWTLEFSDTMKLGGFDAVIGNPPYDVIEKDRGESSWPHTALSGYVASHVDYAAAMGGKTNLFRFFLIRSLALVKSQGRFGMIVPLALLADMSCANTRRFVIGRMTDLTADCFPQKDSSKRRVFANAKLSTAVITGTHHTSSPDNGIIRVRTYPWNSFGDTPRACTIHLADACRIDPRYSPVPLVDEPTWAVCRRLYQSDGLIHMGDCDGIQITRGEINQTIFRAFIKSNPALARLVKGVEIGRYQVRVKLSQGHREWFDETAFRRKYGARPVTQLRRIATQRITGVDERLRIVATIIDPPAYFADSTNSVAVSANSNYDLRYILGLLNSRLFQWRFKLTSTNNNVGTNELEALPFQTIDFADQARKARHDQMVSLTQRILDLHKQLASAKTAHAKTAIQRQIDATDRQIDQLVYELYGLTDQEIRIVEEATT